MTLWTLLHTQIHSLLLKTLEHTALSLSATLIATLIALPLGIWMTYQPRFKAITLGIINIFQTIPSLALLAFLIPLLGIGFTPTIFTLILYAMLPITSNTYTGLKMTPVDSQEAAEAMGLTRWQQLRLIKLPLAQSVIINGIRTATAMTVGITTIAAFVGAGGLGDFITQGLALNHTALILFGAIPIALLALGLDFMLSRLDMILSRRRRLEERFRKTKWAIMLILLSSMLYLTITPMRMTQTSAHQNTIIIGSKNFSEQYILAEMLAILIQKNSTLYVKKRLNLGTSTMAHQALLKGDIDLYPEYTGTAYMTLLHQKEILTAASTYQTVKRMYQKRFQLIWLAPLGFHSSETLAVPTTFAHQQKLKTLSDLASYTPPLQLAAPPEFLYRPDGLPGLAKTYGLRFKKVMQMQLDLTYAAIAHQRVNAILSSTTDARTITHHLTLLQDDRHCYPPYDAAIVIRAQTLKKYPQLQSVLNRLSGLIDQKTIRSLNQEALVQHHTPYRIAYDFLIKKGLIQPGLREPE